MIAATPAWMAARNGTNSTASQPIRRMFDQRQLVMRIRARVAMSGKVLAARRDALSLERRDDGASEPGYILSAFGQCTIADYGVLWIREDVQNRSVVERNADRFELGGQRSGEARCQLLISAAPERLPSAATP